MGIFRRLLDVIHFLKAYSFLRKEIDLPYYLTAVFSFNQIVGLEVVGPLDCFKVTGSDEAKAYLACIV
jgi:hypothetical protein